MTFRDLNIIEPILKAIEEKGYIAPTSIQEKAIPAALAKRDILGCAQTGTGKTASFAIPVIQHLQANKETDKRQGIKALILTPTRELAMQISECIDDYSKYTRVRHGVIFGGVNQRPQVDMLRKGIDILVATPGRLLDLINQGHIHLTNIEYFVLDEADRMLDMGFIHDIKRILPKLPKEKQTLFFSATMPDSIIALTKSLLKNPVKIYITPKSSTVDSIKQIIYFVEKKEKSQLLISILQKAEDRSVLIFSRTKHNADKIVRILGKAGIGSQAIHGNKSQAARQSALGNFKSGKTKVMVATDIASRGIDINELPLVINYVKGILAIAHNGNLTNAIELRHELEYTGAIFQTTIDSEVIAYHIARERLNVEKAEDAVKNAMKKIQGAYALVVSSPRKMIGARDPFGLKPLCIGKRDKTSG